MLRLPKGGLPKGGAVSISAASSSIQSSQRKDIDWHQFAQLANRRGFRCRVTPDPNAPGATLDITA
jgi:hypothetical protein